WTDSVAPSRDRSLPTNTESSSFLPLSRTCFASLRPKTVIQGCLKMIQHNVLMSKLLARCMLLSLVLAALAAGAESQMLPVPLPIPNSPVFSAPQDVSNGVALTFQMAVDSTGNVNLAWQNNFPGDVFFSRSSDGGRTFSAPTDIS